MNLKYEFKKWIKKMDVMELTPSKIKRLVHQTFVRMRLEAKRGQDKTFSISPMVVIG